MPRSIVQEGPRQSFSWGTRLLTLVVAAWAAWLWGWALDLTVTWIGGSRGDTDLRLFALWFAVLGIVFFLTALALWRGSRARGLWAGIGVLGLLGFARLHLPWFVVALLGALRTGTWNKVLPTLLNWEWVREFFIRPLSWRNWLNWLAWGIWSQLLFALHAFLRAAWGVGRKTPTQPDSLLSATEL